MDVEGSFIIPPSLFNDLILKDIPFREKERK